MRPEATQRRDAREDAATRSDAAPERPASRHVQDVHPALAVRPESRVRSSARAFLASFAVHDVVLLVYFFVFVGLVAAGSGEHRSLSALMLVADLAWFALAVTLARITSKQGRAREVFYRMTLVGLIVASYIQLRWILPVVTSRRVDADLLALDLRVFGVEPAIAWDAYVSPTTTEWFAFFYYSYFYLLGAHIFPIAFLERDEHAVVEFAFGILTIFCVAHILYVVVPGVGPHLYWKGFHHELTGDLWWPLVHNMVDAAGAPTDVFPSLHTAVPTFCALHAFRHRKRHVFRWTWLPTAFVALQILISTMFLRWHYMIDVIAGLALSSVVWSSAPVVARWDISRRRRAWLAPVFAPLRPWRRRDAS